MKKQTERCSGSLRNSRLSRTLRWCLRTADIGAVKGSCKTDAAVGGGSAAVEREYD